MVRESSEIIPCTQVVPFVHKVVAKMSWKIPLALSMLMMGSRL